MSDLDKTYGNREGRVSAAAKLVATRWLSDGVDAEVDDRALVRDIARALANAYDAGYRDGDANGFREGVFRA